MPEENRGDGICGVSIGKGFRRAVVGQFTSKGLQMATMTDEAMHELLARTKGYSIMILRSGPKRHQPNVERIIWEHGRRNLELRAEGKIAVVCAVTDDSDVCGLCIFNAEPAETERIMEGHPGVQAGVFLFEVHPCRGFPGDSLPA